MDSKFIKSKPHAPLEERFWRFVDKKSDNECWNWLGQKIRGYGRISVGKRGESSLGAHRFSWQMHSKKYIPKGMFVMHSCDNPSCVNPKHLSLGTPKDNSDDMILKGRKKIVVPVGENNGKAIINADIVRQIRASDMNHTALGRLLGVSPNCVRGVRTGRTWKHIL